MLRRGPQDMPSHWNILIGLGVLYCIVSFLQVVIVAPAGSAVAQSILATVVLVVYVRVVLTMRGKAARLYQTLTALFACGSILTLLLLGPTATLAPMLQAMAASNQTATTVSPPPLAVLLYMVVGFWGLFVFGHIYRQALDVSYFMGICAALCYELVLMFVVMAVTAVV